MKHKLSLVRLLYASIFFSVFLKAAPTPITSAQLGASHVAFSSSSDLSSNPSPGAYGYAFPYLICPPGIGCGGAFRADITGASSGLTVHDATVWCVDAQLDVNVGSSYYANIVSLTNTAALNDPTLTRYGADGTQLPSQWVNAISGFSDSASRFRLAASLVMQLQDSSLSGDYSKPFDQTFNASLSGSPVLANDLTARNEAIQRAIWWITYNNVNGPPSPANITGNLAAGVSGVYSDWVHYAMKNVSSLDLSSWAIISGPATIGGAVLPPDNAHYQTYLVQMTGLQVQATPEPQHLALLIAGLVAMLWFRRPRSA
jgi:hypothetical protein